MSRGMVAVGGGVAAERTTGPLGPHRGELGRWYPVELGCLACVRGGRVFLVFGVLVVLPLAAPENGEAGSDRTR